uniref:Ribbon-helix-helix protein, copG family n=1 Tax=Candidatus Kentrum sp. LFY TaxID=2126342 RepID=A0A450UR90_9GAMM|nr:MAG: hypothetical protein BECKLFY1418B_GA0070995_100952 [Candidatus Kentron sp. LFY]VFJ95072.1 MAG: hypothetical protein BECKLFY1418A_GA0070994_104616 [Candidatus Kentron sp. LFY]VFK19288.1 MAG: hypothetical protein BECKLFY1418C_GA0070996_10563 [Candidatus Kentron sp. LFY]
MPILTLDIPDDIYESVSDFARNRNIPEGEAMKRAFALLRVADQEIAEGESLGIVREDESNELHAITRIEGL